jgi:hypothetical protein
VGTLLVTRAYADTSPARAGEAALNEGPDDVQGEPVDVRSLPGWDEITALAAAYPDRIEEAAVLDGEWALRMDDTWYTWADGRLLPEALRDRADEFVSIRFYRYERGPVQERVVDEELERVLATRTRAQADGDTDDRLRFNSFLDDLYGVDSARSADILVQRVRFLGMTTRVHPILLEPLAQVERTILALRPHDPEVAEFVNGLGSIHGFNWRNIAGTLRRSYHSYGVALDLVPRSYDRSWPYWLWAAEGGIDRWWELPLSSRWQIPQGVIDAFEDQGFIWGGKWLFFDNLHFEYRPESLIMADRR